MFNLNPFKVKEETVSGLGIGSIALPGFPGCYKTDWPIKKEITNCNFYCDTPIEDSYAIIAEANNYAFCPVSQIADMAMTFCTRQQLIDAFDRFETNHGRKE